VQTTEGSCGGVVLVQIFAQSFRFVKHSYWFKVSSIVVGLMQWFSSGRYRPPGVNWTIQGVDK